MIAVTPPLTRIEKFLHYSSFIHWVFSGKAELKKEIRNLKEEHRKALHAVATEMIKVQELEQELARLKAK